MVEYVRFVKERSIPPNKSAVKIINGVPVTVFNVDGEFKAFVAVCPHKFHVLCHRELVRGMIMCQGHGELFNVETGEPTVGKAKERLRRLNTQIKDGVIFVEKPGEAILKWIQKSI